MNKHAYILFTRVPIPNKVKTRLQSSLSGKEACEVQLRMLRDSFIKFEQLSEQGIDLYLAYSDEGDPTPLISALPESFNSFSQEGQTIGERMDHAIKHVLAIGYEKVILTGSDIPNLTNEIIQTAFEQMQEIVLGPSLDGGYYLIGCTRGIDLSAIFETNISWGKSDVLAATLKRLTGFEVSFVSPLQDIDYPVDLKRIHNELVEGNYYLSDWLEKNRGLLE
ncbi:MAG: TIGR04282 family arsenosugar biosynthesis glycosyltransferase [Enterococcus malodoratus]